MPTRRIRILEETNVDVSLDATRSQAPGRVPHRQHVMLQARKCFAELTQSASRLVCESFSNTAVPARGRIGVPIESKRYLSSFSIAARASARPSVGTGIATCA